MSAPPDLTPPQRISLSEPDAFLASLTASPWFHLDLDRVDVIEMWGLVALCALSRSGAPDAERSDVYHRRSTKTGRFAHAVGFDAGQAGTATAALEAERTVPIQRVTFGQPLGRLASELARIVVPGDLDEESRGALAYVIDELLRNVLQHSGDPLGAVVGAQLMRAGKGGYTRPTAQVAVADAGRGVLALAGVAGGGLVSPGGPARGQARAPLPEAERGGLPGDAGGVRAPDRDRRPQRAHGRHPAARLGESPRGR